MANAEDTGSDGKTLPLEQFKCFYDWSISFCAAAKIDLEVKTQEADIADSEAELTKLKEMQRSLEQCVEDSQSLNFAQFFDDAADNVASRKSFLD